MVNVLDANKDGKVDFGEFLHWVAVECSRPTSEREKKRRRSEFHNELQNFVDAVRETSRILLNEKRQLEKKVVPLEEGLAMVFAKYDADGSGFMVSFWRRFPPLLCISYVLSFFIGSYYGLLTIQLLCVCIYFSNLQHFEHSNI